MLEAFRERNALVVERVRRIPGFKLPNVPQGAFYAFPNVSELLGSRFGDKTNHRRRHARGIPARRGARLAGRRQRLRRARSRPAFVRHFDEESERGIRSHRARCREAQALASMAERADLRTSLRRLPITTTAAAVLAIVAAVSPLASAFAPPSTATTTSISSSSTAGGRTIRAAAIRGSCKVKQASCGRTYRVDATAISAILRRGIFSARPASTREPHSGSGKHQMICLVVAVLLLARGNDPPLGAAPTIIILSLVLMSRQFAGALVGCASRADAAGSVVCVMVLRAERASCGRGTLPGAGGVAETLSG